jgi:hypothetical protein
VFRRIVSLLLLPGLMLSQAAAAGHAHGDHTPADHSARPHVHTLPAAEDRHHAHGHHHGPGGHHHQHDDEDESAPTVPPPQADPLSDHDTDAVFVPTDAVVVERAASVEVIPVAVVWVVCDTGEPIGATLSVFVYPARNGRPPPDPACPLYVRHLALLM